MQTVFLRLLNISITAGWLVLAVVLMRLVMKRAPKALRCAAWALVALRLLLPFTIESSLSLVPSAETVPPAIIYEEQPAINSGILALNYAVNPYIAERFAPAEAPASEAAPSAVSGAVSAAAGSSARPNRLFPVALAASIVWLSGTAAMLIYAVISFIILARRVREAAPDGGVFLLDSAPTPFIFGIFRPRIILPSSIGAADRVFAVAHEKAHIARGDHLVKPAAFLLLAVYWFNPLIWLAYLLFCRDIELACDEKVLMNGGSAIRRAYSEALINCSVPRRGAFVSPLAFGESNIKRRVKNVMRYKKPAFWVLILSLVVIAALAVAFLTSPIRTRSAGRSIDTGLYTLTRAEISKRMNTRDDAFVGCDFGVIDTEKHGGSVIVYGFAHSGLFAVKTVPQEWNCRLALPPEDTSDSGLSSSDSGFVTAVSSSAPIETETMFSCSVSEEEGESYPFVLKAKRSPGAPTGWSLVSFRVPGTENWESDVKKLFPPRIAEDILLGEEGASGKINSALYERMLYLARSEAFNSPWYPRDSVFSFRTRFVNRAEKDYMLADFSVDSAEGGAGKCVLRLSRIKQMNGSYSRTDDSLILDFGDEGKLVFRSAGGMYVFDYAASDMETAALTDGMVFYPDNWLATDHCAFDMRLTPSESYKAAKEWTLGRSTSTRGFALTVGYVGGSPAANSDVFLFSDEGSIAISFTDSLLYEFIGVFAVPEGDYVFTEQNGELMIRGVDRDGTEHYYAIEIRIPDQSGSSEGVFLTEDGKEIPRYSFYGEN